MNALLERDFWKIAIKMPLEVIPMSLFFALFSSFLCVFATMKRKFREKERETHS